MSSTKSTIGNFLTILVNYPLTIIVGILVTRDLGAHDKGLYAFLMLISTTLLPIMLFGFPGGLMYNISSQKFLKQNVYYSSIFTGGLLGIGCSLFVLTMITMGWFGETAQEVPQQCLILILLILPVEGIFLVNSYYLKGSSQYKYMNILQISRSVMLSLLLLMFVLLFQLGLPGVVYALVLTKTITAIVAISIVIKKNKPLFQIETVFIKRCFKHGIKLWLGIVSTTSNARMDQFLLSLFATPSLLGIFAVATNIVELIRLPSVALSTVLFNKISKLESTKDVVEVTGQVHRALFLIVFLLAVIIALSAPFLVYIYGEEFSSALYPIYILLPGMLFYSVTRVIITKFLGATGNPLQTSLIQLIGAIIGVVLYLFLIPSMDIYGAALASSISYLSSTGVALYLLKKATPQNKVNLFRIELSDFQWIWARVSPLFKLDKFFPKKA